MKPMLSGSRFLNINKCYAERVAVEGEARDEGEDAHAALAAAVVCCGAVQIASKVHVTP